MSNKDIPQSAFKRSDSKNSSENSLWHYVQSLSPETITHLSQPECKEVFEIIEHNITGLLGNMPQSDFQVEINTNRQNLGQLLASAMLSGYFLRNAEQRMGFEQSLMGNQLNS
ncbi:MAG: hypothetical protein RLZZ574_3351 [Cyanobacteriota bacterium]